MRDREFAVLDVAGHGRRTAGARRRRRRVTRVKKLEAGFFTISGAAVDAAGTLYFVDHHQQRIFSWSAARGLVVVRDAPHDPVNLAVAKSGDVLVVSSAGPEGTVYTFNPAKPADELTVLEPQPAAPRPDAAVVLPVNVWVNGELEDQLDLGTYEYATLAQLFAREVATPSPRQYVSPDGSLVLPAGRVFQQPGVDSYAGMDETGWRWSHTLDAYGLLTASPGPPDLRRQRRREPHLSRHRAGQRHARRSAAVRRARRRERRRRQCRQRLRRERPDLRLRRVGPGRRAGSTCPERPVQILFGGPDRRTLFILTHHALYSVTTRAPGEPGPWGT